MALTLRIPSRASAFANSAHRVLPYSPYFGSTVYIHTLKPTVCGTFPTSSVANSSNPLFKNPSYEAPLPVDAMLPSRHVQWVPYVLQIEYGRAAVFNPKRPYFRHSGTTSSEGICGVCVRYLIASKHVWHGACAVMRYSPSCGDAVYVPMLTPTVYGIFSNSRVDEICRSF